MSFSNLQKPVLYLVAAACLVGGIAMMFSGPETPEHGDTNGPNAAPGNAPAIPSHTMHGPSGSIIGTGGYDQSNPQIVFENGPEPVETTKADPFAFVEPESEDQRRRRVRMEELRPVLEQLGGEPVYVEGLDNRSRR